MAEIDWDSVPRTGGVYCMYDLDEHPVYVGSASESKSRHLVARLREHFVQQNSSVVAHGRIDLLDVWYVDIWSTPDYESAEDQLISALNPVFNRESPILDSHPIDPSKPDVRLSICSDDERSVRLQPPNRIQSKMTHIQQMLDADRVALEALARGRTARIESAREAAQFHLSIIRKAIDEQYS